MIADPHVHETESGTLVRAALALGAIATLVLGVPTLLMALTQRLPLDLSALEPAAWAHADDGRVLLLAVLALAWLAWAALVLSVAVEVMSALRRTATPRLPGLAVPQRMAAGLVACVLVALSSTAASGSQAAATMPLGGPVPPAASSPVAAMASKERSIDGGHPGGRSLLHLVAAADVAADRTGPSPSTEGAPPNESSPERKSRAVTGGPQHQGPSPSVQVRRHDTLWMLAEAHLGAGQRYVEIVALNRGLAQPDGRSLADDGRLYPGWTLALPADAVVDVARGERYRVQSGDTLWDIADAELGDPERYPEIAKANQGDLQPDGRRLRDPDLIQPGWVLELPEVATTSPEVPADRQGRGLEALPDLDRATPSSPERPPSTGDQRGDGPKAPTVQPNGPIELDRGARADGAAGFENRSEPAGGTHGARDGVSRGSPPVGSATDLGTPDLDRSALRSVAVDDTELAAQRIAAQDPDDPAATAIDPGNGMATLPNGGVLASLLLAGLGAELVRRRRQYQRYRRPGEQLAAPTAATEEVERASRAAQHRREPGLLDLALSRLAQAADESESGLPDVRLVRVSAERVTLHLAAPSNPVLQPFRAAGDLLWVLDAQGLGTADVDRSRAFPALITLGTIGPETVLLNLESVGTLAVTGVDPDRADVLRGLAAELAFGPASSSTERTLCVSDRSIADAVEPGSIGVDLDPARVSAAVAVTMQTINPRLERGEKDPESGPPLGQLCERPLAHGHAGDDPFLIVLSDQPLAEVVVPNPRCGLITTAQAVDWSGATLVVQSPESAVLLPERQQFTPQTMSRAATDDLIEVVRSADLPADELASSERASSGRAPDLGEPPDERGSASGVIDLRGRPPAAAQPNGGPAEYPLLARGPAPTAPDSGAPRLLLLGGLEVLGAQGRAESTRIGRLAQTAAFVLLNPDARPSELQSALWPGRRSNPQTCRQMISRTRTWLGRTPQGEPYLMPFTQTQGRLRLRGDVGSDWSDFQRLAQAGLADPDDTEHLAAALALVRGRPFGAVAARELPWADLHINHMIGAITDVAHALATRLESAGLRAQAHDAALRGLCTESESEVLEGIVARTGP